VACLSSASSSVLARVEHRVGDEGEEYYGLVYVPEHHEVSDIVLSGELAVEESGNSRALGDALMDFVGANAYESSEGLRKVDVRHGWRWSHSLVEAVVNTYTAAFMDPSVCMGTRTP